MNLVMKQLKARAMNKYIARDVRLKAAIFSGQGLDEAGEPQERQYQRFTFCRNRKTRFFSYICKKIIFLEHSKHTCPECVQKYFYL